MATLGTDGTALLVIDMQNGFCHPDGSFARLDLDVSRCNAAIAGCRALVDLAREAGVPVIYTRYVYRADYADGGVLVKELLPALAEAQSLAAGTWDAELVDELEVRPEDEVVFVVRDATGELDAQRHEMALATLGFGFGRVVDVEHVRDAWAAPQPDA